MNTSILFALFTIFAVAHSADYTCGPSYYNIAQGVSTGVGFSILNNANVSLTSVYFTATPSDSNVFVSYPSGATRSTIGTITVGSTGSGGFYLMGAAGSYTLTFSISYKKNGTLYSASYSASLAVGDSSGGSKREAEFEIDTLNPEAPIVQARVQSVRGTDITLSPTYYQTPAGIPTWVNLYISASTLVKNVSFAVAPSDSNVYINYPPTGNYIGQITANHAVTTSFQINGPAGSYSLTIIAQYRKGTNTTYLYEVVTAGLAIGDTSSGSKRSELDLDFSEKAAVEAGDINNVEASIKTEYVIGFGVGIALLAGIAVGAAVVAVKRSATNTIA